MKFIRPAPITDLVLIASSVAEADYAAWNAATTYATGQRVIRTQTHRIYESPAGGNLGKIPESSPAAWVDIGPTNRWAMFDRALGTRTTAAGALTVTVAPGFVDSVALLNVSGATGVRVTMTSGGVTVYDRTIDMGDAALLTDWFDYFFADLAPRSDVTLTDLPLYGDGQLTVSLTGPGAVSCGAMVVGQAVEIGRTLRGSRVGIVDYSRKETNAFGVVDVVERAYARRIEVAVWVESGRVDYVAQRLAEVRATPVVWIGADGRYQSLIAYGFCKDWQTVIQYVNASETNLTIESLT